MNKLFLTLVLLTTWQCVWADAISYYECSWNPTKKVVEREQKSVEAKKLSEAAKTGNNIEIQNGWYFVDQNVNIDVLFIKGNDVHLILKDNTVLDCKGGVRLDADYKLTIHSQSYGAERGKLQATNALFPDNAAIGCGNQDKRGMGTLEIHGGTIWAMSVSNGRGAGIGGGNDSFIGGSVTIYDGSWDVGGAGIGGGDKCNSGVIKIHGGKVEAISSENAGAAIGGGRKGNSGEITIDGRIKLIEGTCRWYAVFVKVKHDV